MLLDILHQFDGSSTVPCKSIRYAGKVKNRPQKKKKINEEVPSE